MVTPRTLRPVKSVLIATLPRSGSWLLAEALEGTRRCGHPREYFRPDYRPDYSRAWGLSPRAPFIEFFCAVLAKGTTPNGTFSAKLHWGQVVDLHTQMWRGTASTM